MYLRIVFISSSQVAVSFLTADPNADMDERRARSVVDDIGETVSKLALIVRRVSFTNWDRDMCMVMSAICKSVFSRRKEPVTV